MGPSPVQLVSLYKGDTETRIQGECHVNTNKPRRGPGTDSLTASAGTHPADTWLLDFRHPEL